MGNAMRSQVSPAATLPSSYDSHPKLSDSDILVVIRDYPSSNISEPIYRVGEKLRVLAEEGCWWKVSSLMTAVENYIPNEHVAKVYHEWLFEGVDRQKSEELLNLPGNRVGSFMIRERQGGRGIYSLSVKHRSIMHYRICRLPNNWYYISPRLTFQCLEDLVNHYYDSADGLCCVLIAPCLAFATSALSVTLPASPVVMRRNNNFDWSNEERSTLTSDQVWRGSTLLSFGVRDSVASYLTITASGSHLPRKKKSKSMYGVPNHRLEREAEED